MGWRRLVPTRVKHVYWRWAEAQLWRDLRKWARAKNIDLQRVLIGGEGFYKGLAWNEITDDLQKPSTLLAQSPEVSFLQQYLAMGEKLFDWENFEKTAYYRAERQWLRFDGNYFAQRTPEGFLAQARAFATLYERIKKGDQTEVAFPTRTGHSRPGSLPVVRPTLTRSIFRIAQGHHRLAIAWVLGKRKARAVILPPPLPTELQSLVLNVAQAEGQPELCQPIASPEFDSSWKLRQPCAEQWATMLRFLAREPNGRQGLSVLSLGCSYGWFLSQFSARGCQVIGVDPDPAALKIGRLAYGLRAEQLVQSDLPTFVAHCPRTFDIVLLMGGMYQLARKPHSGSPGELLQQVDRMTARYLFLDAGFTREAWWRASFREWDYGALVQFLKQHTSFTQVRPLSLDPNQEGRQGEPAGTLLACFRS